jgi:hypothetical protein
MRKPGSVSDRAFFIPTSILAVWGKLSAKDVVGQFISQFWPKDSQRLSARFARFRGQ